MTESPRKNEIQYSPIVHPLWLIAIMAVGFVMSSAAVIFVWLVSSLFLFALLDPVHYYLNQRKVPSYISAGLLVVLASLITMGVGYALGHFSANIIMDLEDSKRVFFGFYESLSSQFKKITEVIGNISNKTSPIEPSLGAKITKVQVVQGSPLGGDLGSTIIHGLGNAVKVATFALLIPILTFFIMLERNALALVINFRFKDKNKGPRIWRKIKEATRAYFVGNIVLGLLTYPLFVLVFFLFGIKALFTTAALATFFNLVPFLGAVLSGFLPALTLLGQNQGWIQALGVFGSCLAIHFALANFVTPKVLGSKVDLNAMTSTVALIVWGELWGGVGLILAIPITALIKILLEESEEPVFNWIAALMSEKAILSLDPNYKKDLSL